MLNFKQKTRNLELTREAAKWFNYKIKLLLLLYFVSPMLVVISHLVVVCSNQMLSRGSRTLSLLRLCSSTCSNYCDYTLLERAVC